MDILDNLLRKRVMVDINETDLSSKKKRVSNQLDTKNNVCSNTSDEENFDDETDEVDGTTDGEEDEDIDESGEEDGNEIAKMEPYESTDKEDGEQSDEQSDEEDNIEDYLNGAEEVRKTLTPEQREVFDYVLRLKKDQVFGENNPRAVFVGGAAGTGKTELLKNLCDCIKKAVFTAATGVAAQNYPSGRTAHSMFGFARGQNVRIQRCHISDYRKEEILESNIIVFDEVQMVNVIHIKMLDKSLKTLMSSEKRFGGKIIIFAGDFLQVIPVVDGADSPADFSPKSYFDNSFIKKFELSFPYRVNSDRGYFTFLKQLVQNSHAMLKYIAYRTNITDLINFVYPKYIISKPNKCSRRAILALTNLAVDEINNEILKMTSETTRITTLKSKDFGNCDLLLGKDPLSDQVFPEKQLKLWKGCLCMIIRNTYEPVMLLNGAKVIVEKITSNRIYVREPGKHTIIPIEQQRFVRYGRDASTFEKTQAQRWQFPLKLCYAMSFYKSQGQTLDRVGIDLTKNVFAHGQLYLALSRVRHRQDMMVCVNKWQIHDNVARVTNVVHEPLTF